MIRIEEVSKRFGEVEAVDDVSLTVAENEFFALLGPSGCGKTTLLRLLAGFETPDSGKLLLDEENMVGVKPYRRPLNMMFQSYALFPHMSVEQNVAYGLRMDGVGKEEARARARELLELVQLPEIGSRRPAQLSGGQRQRVALARALARSPRVLLLDEPLSALDRQMRGEMQIELKRLQHQLGITFVVVTHDQEEALTMADRIAVMRAGKVEQVGTPTELYEEPRTRFVAGFLGEANVFGGEVGDSRVGQWRVRDEQLSRHGLAAGDEAFVVVRPENVHIAAAGSADSAGVVNVVEGTIAEVAYLGTSRKYVVDLPGGGTVQARVGVRLDRSPLTAGDRVRIGWELEDGRVVVGEAAAESYSSASAAATT
jgi:spermidine/putrescine ABC transporter ATP-binding subunit